MKTPSNPAFVIYCVVLALLCASWAVWDHFRARHYTATSTIVIKPEKAQ